MATVPQDDHTRNDAWLAYLASPETSRKFAALRQEREAEEAREAAREARKLHNRDLAGWLDRAANTIERLGHDAARLAAGELRELATEVRFVGQGVPISPAEFEARRAVLLAPSPELATGPEHSRDNDNCRH